MKRVLAATFAATLVIAACGGGDSDPDADGEEVPAEQPADEPATEPAGEAATEPVTEPTAAPAENSSDEGDRVDAVGIIMSLDQVPQACREQMTARLRAMEPVVSSIDWQNATLNDFSTIEEEFSAISDEFDALEADVGCDDLDFGPELESELIIELARQVAPDTTGFLGFLDALGAFDDDEGDSSPDDGSGGDEGAAGDSPFANCTTAISYIQDLMIEYPSYLDIPASQLMEFAQIATAYATCTPEQFEYFTSPEFEAWIGGE
jgi:hypothetical protein